MVADNKEPRILTPFDEDRVYRFNGNKLPVHVMEVPGCSFHDLPVCLATADTKELGKLKCMVQEFASFYAQAAEKVCGAKP